MGSGSDHSRNTSKNRRGRNFADKFELPLENPKMQAVNNKLAREKEAAFRELIMQQITAEKITADARYRCFYVFVNCAHLLLCRWPIVLLSLKSTVAYKQLNALPAQTPEEVFLSCMKGLDAKSQRSGSEPALQTQQQVAIQPITQPSSSNMSNPEKQLNPPSPEKKQRTDQQEQQRQRQQRLQALQAQWRGETPVVPAVISNQPSEQGVSSEVDSTANAGTDTSQPQSGKDDEVDVVDPISCTIGDLLSEMHEKRCREDAKQSALPPKQKAPNASSTPKTTISAGAPGAPGTGAPPGAAVAYNQYMNDPVYTAQYTQYYNYYAAQGMDTNTAMQWAAHYAQQAARANSGDYNEKAKAEAEEKEIKKKKQIDQQKKEIVDDMIEKLNSGEHHALKDDKVWCKISTYTETRDQFLYVCRNCKN